jgi:hypothetical protein
LWADVLVGRLAAILVARGDGAVSDELRGILVQTGEGADAGDDLQLDGDVFAPVTQEQRGENVCAARVDRAGIAVGKGVGTGDLIDSIVDGLGVFMPSSSASMATRRSVWARRRRFAAASGSSRATRRWILRRHWGGEASLLPASIVAST